MKAGKTTSALCVVTLLVVSLIGFASAESHDTGKKSYDSSTKDSSKTSLSFHGWRGYGYPAYGAVYTTYGYGYPGYGYGYPAYGGVYGYGYPVYGAAIYAAPPIYGVPFYGYGGYGGYGHGHRHRHHHH